MESGKLAWMSCLRRSRFFVKKMIFVLPALCFFLSCQKEDTQLPCQANKFGGHCFENITGDPISVYVDGSFRFNLAAGAKECVPQLSPGLHQVRGEQAATSKEWEGSFDVVQCGLKDTVFRP